MAVEAHMEE
jgi:hypothetical protein